MKCKLCKKEMSKKTLQSHMELHIEDSFKEEIAAFHKTQEARQIYKKLFDKDI